MPEQSQNQPKEKDMNNQVIANWAKTAKPREQIVYYVGGNLAANTDVSDDNGIQAIRDLYDDGRISLAQKRLSKGNGSEFEYIAIMRKRRANIERGHKFSFFASSFSMTELLAA
jgi:hypothetical protein